MPVGVWQRFPAAQVETLPPHAASALIRASPSHHRSHCYSRRPGIKPITAEAWSKDTERYASPWDRIGIGYTDAGDAEAHRRFLEWKRYNGPNDVQRKLLDESMSYQEAIRQKRNKRRFHGAIGLDRFG